MSTEAMQRGGGEYAYYPDLKIKKRCLYNHGLPFSTGLDLNLDDIKLRVEKNKAALIVIDGGVGEGKTTLCVECAEYITGLELIFKEQLAMGGGDFARKLKICFKAGYFIVIYDEAGDFNKRGALTRFNAMLNRIFETYRAFKILVILCLPSFSVLDNSLFDKQIPRLLLHCEDRNELYGNYKGYSLYRMFYLREKMKKLVVKPFAYSLVEPNFRGHFLDLKPARAKELDKFTISGKLDILDESEIVFEGMLSFYELSEKLEMSVSWIKKKMMALEIKERKVHKNRKYFDQGVLEILVEVIEQEHIKPIEENKKSYKKKIKA